MPTILAMVLQEFLLNVNDEIANVRATVEQIVQLVHNLLTGSAAALCLQRFVPLASAVTQLVIDLVQFFFEMLLRGLQAYFQGSSITARGTGFAQFVE